MKKTLVLSALAVSGFFIAASAQATVYGDAIGDEAFAPLPHLDIASVEVTQSGSDILFKINLSGDPIATDWGKYLVAIDSVPGGDTAGNAWGRPISMPSGMDFWVGSWVDFGNGAETYSWDGAVWNLDNATYNPPSDIGLPVVTTSSVTLETSLASLGLGVGNTFVFDVFTTGGGGTDSAIDALSDPITTIADWSDPYTSASTLTYTVVPEPATFALCGLGLATLLVFRRRNA